MAQHRRALGLLAFWYVAMHFLAYMILDKRLALDVIAEDIFKRWFITIGMAAFLLLVPLVATSNDRAVRRMGAARWRKLHWLTYPAALLAALHFVWLVKAWPLEPLFYLGAVLGLLGLRVVAKGARSASRRKGATAPSPTTS